MKNARYLRLGKLLVAWLVISILYGGVCAASGSSAQGIPESRPAGTCPTDTTPVPLPITLTVTLQRPNSPPPSAPWAVPVRLALYPPGDPVTICHQWDLTLDQNGQWSGLLDMFTGAYDVRVKNIHTLRNVKRNVSISGPLAIDMGTLLEGDADNDNRVRSSDFALLSAAYFANEGEPRFDPRADFDEDNRIRSSDFALLSSNYFKSGDIEVSGLLGQAAARRPLGLVDLAIEPASAQVQPGEMVTLTLIAHAGDQPFVAADADIRFPPATLRVVSPMGEPATAIEPLPPLLAFYNQVDNAAGRILYAAGLFTGSASGDVPLARIRFLALDWSPRANVNLVDGTVADASGRFVTGSLSGAWIAIVPEGGFRYRYLPLIFGAR